jgi:hypothetical protein
MQLTLIFDNTASLSNIQETDEVSCEKKWASFPYIVL